MVNGRRLALRAKDKLPFMRDDLREKGLPQTIWAYVYISLPPNGKCPTRRRDFYKRNIYIQVMECALCILLIFRFVTCDERFTNLQSGSLLEIDNIPESWVPQPKRAMFVFWSWTKCLSERSRNSHFCSFLGMEVSDSCSRTVKSFFHSLPIP